MRGRSSYTRQPIQPDLQYNSILVEKFINRIMQDGKKDTSRRLVYKAFEEIANRSKKNPLEVFEQAIKNASPLLEVRSRRIGGATYQVPMEVRPERKVALAMRWIIESARQKQGKPMSDFLVDEIMDTYNETGTAMKKKEEMHKMAEANKAFAHFARF